MREKTKVVEINGKSYEIGRFTPQTGSWIANLLITTMLKSQKDGAPETQEESADDKVSAEEKAAGLVSILWLMASSDLPEATYARIQNHALLVCGQIHQEGAGATGIIKESGKWIATELQDDAPTISKLVTEALQFNIAPFFLEGVSNSAAQK